MVSGPQPSILLLGCKGSGKTSIKQVALERVSPSATSKLLPTTIMEATQVDDNQSFRFEVWDGPGEIDALQTPDAHSLLESCAAILFVIDSTARLDEPIQRLVQAIRLRDDTAQRTNSVRIHVEVFLHKTDLLEEGEREEMVCRLQTALASQLAKPLKRESYHCTSIFDYSVFRAFSVAVQRVVKKKQAYMQSLLECLTTKCQMQMSYLFISKTKLFVAEGKPNQENNSTDHTFFRVCAEAMDMMTQLDGMYRALAVRQGGASLARSRHHAQPQIEDDERTAKCTHLNFTAETDGMGDAIGGPELPREPCSSVIHLSNQTVLYVREISNDFAVLMLMAESEMENRALIDYNVAVFSTGISEICSARDK